MNILRYIIALLLLFGCIISMSAAAVPDVRSVVRQDGAVVESTDYYPYGTPFTTTNSVQPYKYGTKVLDRMHGLDLYDSQARWYDALTGRTSTLDPKAEKYYNLSPYTWCAGNPVKYVDPTGEETYLYATTLPGFLPNLDKKYNKATHTFIVVALPNGATHYFAYGSEITDITGAFSGQLKQQSYEQDKLVYQGKDTEHLKAKILVNPPSGMTSEEFDNKVIDVATSFGNNSEISYFFLPSESALTEGNCNTSTSTILIKSGVSSSKISEIKKQIPGWSYGFSEKERPWTSEEQERAVIMQRLQDFINSLIISH